MGLRPRLILAVVIASCSINLFLSFYFIAHIKESALQHLNTRIEKSVDMMKLVNARPLYNVDREMILVNMETFFDDENMKSISLKADEINFDIKFEREFSGKSGNDIVKKFTIPYQGLNLGQMTVVYSTGLIEQGLGRLRYQILLVTLFVIALLAVALIYIVNRVLRPVTELTKAASAIASGDLDQEIEQGGVGEVGELSRNFAGMRDAVKEKINDLATSKQNLEKEIILKEINEKKILKKSKVITSVNTFFQQAMLAGSYNEIARIFIPIALDVIPGQYCFVGEVNKDNKEKMDILAMSDQAVTDCKMTEISKDIRIKGQKVKGISACIINGGTTVFSNLHRSHPDALPLPENHVPIASFLGVPMKLGQEMKGIIAFAGKKGGYDTDDREAAEMLSVALVEALSLKKREDEKAKLEEMMVQSEKMISIGGLAAGMAHEINNPLAGILQNAQVIRNRLKNRLPANVSAAAGCGIELDDIQAYMEKRDIYKMIEFILDAGKRAADIVANMLSFSRKNTSGVMPEDAAWLLDKTLELAGSDYSLKKKFDFKRIRIEKDYAPGIPKILCRASEIQQVFFNILSNGAQAMMAEQEGVIPCFILRITRDGKMVRIEITDNGPGIEEESKNRIFEPFFTTKTVGEGTGLGLAVSYFIITENHNGSIQVRSEPSKGTSFIIKLPAAEGESQE